MFLHPCLWFTLSRWDRVLSALGGPEAMAKLQVRAGGTGWVRSRSSLCLEQPLSHRVAGTPPSTSSDVPCLSHGLFASCLG